MCQVYGRGSQGFSLTETQADTGVEVHSTQWNLSILFFFVGNRKQQKKTRYEHIILANRKISN